MKKFEDMTVTEKCVSLEADLKEAQNELTQAESFETAETYSNVVENLENQLGDLDFGCGDCGECSHCDRQSEKEERRCQLDNLG